MVRPASLPITLLYIDFPGLGDRWEEATKDTATGLFRAHDHFSDTVAALGGQPVSAWLDARCASFAAPAVAVAAALAFQDRASDPGDLPWRLALANGRTGPGRPIPVPLLHRVRLLAESGHRNEMRLAASTAELVTPDLPPNARLVALGPRQFSDTAAEPDFRLLVRPPLDRTGIGTATSSPDQCLSQDMEEGGDPWRADTPQGLQDHAGPSCSSRHASRSPPASLPFTASGPETQWWPHLPAFQTVNALHRFTMPSMSVVGSSPRRETSS